MVKNQLPCPAEMRGFIASTQEIVHQLQKNGAEFKGGYAFTDSIYSYKNSPFDLNKEFFRLRQYEKTAWDQKNIVFTHKRIDVRGQVGINLVKKEFDTLDQVNPELIHYRLLFSFSRTGTEYYWNQMRIFVEDIQGLPPSIEVIAPSCEQIFYFFAMIDAKMITESVPALMEKYLIQESM